MKLIALFLAAFALASAQPAMVQAQAALQIANDSTTGTKPNRLAVLTSTGQVVSAATTDTTSIVGIVTQGAGKTGMAFIPQGGFAACDFDGPTTAQHYVTASTTSAALCHDAGASQPTGVSVVGRVALTGSTQVFVFPVGAAALSGAAANPAGSTGQIQINSGGAFGAVDAKLSNFTNDTGFQTSPQVQAAITALNLGTAANHPATDFQPALGFTPQNAATANTNNDALGAAAAAQTAAIAAAANASNLSSGTVPIARIPALAYVTPATQQSQFAASIPTSAPYTPCVQGTSPNLTFAGIPYVCSGTAYVANPGPAVGSLVGGAVGSASANVLTDFKDFAIDAGASSASSNNDAAMSFMASYFSANQGSQFKVPQNSAGSSYIFKTPVSLPYVGFQISGDSKNGTPLNFCPTASIGTNPAFNFTGASYIDLNHLLMVSSCRSFLPTADILLQRSAPGTASGNHVFKDFLFSGPSSLATFASIASEQNTFFGGKIGINSNSTATDAFLTAGFDYWGFTASPTAASTNLGIRFFGTDFQSQIANSNCVHEVQDSSSGEHLYAGDYCGMATGTGSGWLIQAPSTTTNNIDIISIESARVENGQYGYHWGTALGGAASTLFNLSLMNSSYASGGALGCVQGDTGVTLDYHLQFHNNCLGVSNSVDMLTDLSFIYEKAFTVRTSATNSFIMALGPTIPNGGDNANFIPFYTSPYYPGFYNFEPTGTILLRQAGSLANSAHGPSLNVPNTSNCNKPSGGPAWANGASGDICEAGNQLFHFDAALNVFSGQGTNTFGYNQPAMLGGTAQFSQISNSTVSGNLAVAAMSGVPGTPTLTNTGANNGVTYSYVVQALGQGATTHSANSAVGMITAGPSSLGGSSCIQLTWSASGTNTATFAVYRTTGGATQGKITGSLGVLGTLMTDCGIVADGTTPNNAAGGGMLTALDVNAQQLVGSGTAPSISGCGTSPTLTTGSTTLAGSVTMGTSATGCTITWATAFTATPIAQLVTASNGTIAYPNTASTTALVVTNVTASAGGTIHWMNVGK